MEKLESYVTEKKVEKGFENVLSSTLFIIIISMNEVVVLCSFCEEFHNEISHINFGRDFLVNAQLSTDVRLSANIKATRSKARIRLC